MYQLVGEKMDFWADDAIHNSRPPRLRTCTNSPPLIFIPKQNHRISTKSAAGICKFSTTHLFTRYFQAFVWQYRRMPRIPQLMIVFERPIAYSILALAKRTLPEHWSSQIVEGPLKGMDSYHLLLRVVTCYASAYPVR